MQVLAKKMICQMAEVAFDQKGDPTYIALYEQSVCVAL
jgi:hypothetical protein